MPPRKTAVVSVEVKVTVPVKSVAAPPEELSAVTVKDSGAPTRTLEGVATILNFASDERPVPVSVTKGASVTPEVPASLRYMVKVEVSVPMATGVNSTV